MQGVRHSEGFYLEYRDGDPEHHYSAKGHFTLDQALNIVDAYVSGDDSWRNACDWEKLER